MFIFVFLANCFVSIFNCLNLFTFPDTNIGFGTIVVGLSLLGAIFKFIDILSNSRMSIEPKNSANDKEDLSISTSLTIIDKR